MIMNCCCLNSVKRGIKIVKQLTKNSSLFTNRGKGANFERRGVGSKIFFLHARVWVGDVP